jgi:EAL domain-containing protein (putative c-di-GMP-specific phosphodiesterase class I)
MLKIDKSFVVDMMRDESDAAIVHSIIDLAHNLGLQVVAEGVESDQTWSWLKTWDCDHAQGYYISPPLALKDFEKYIESYSTANVFTHN